MKILNFGSVNIDFVFSVDKIVRPGETIDSSAAVRHPGGKGLNQSIALARAGADAWHAGLIGEDGLWLKALLESSGANCRYLTSVDAPTGSAFIQVERSGQNSIVLNGGANRLNTPALCDSVLADFSAGDVLLLQNEISCVDYLIGAAHKRGMRVVLNPSPINDALLAYPLELVDCFILNELEGQRISGCPKAEDVMDALHSKFPSADIVLTLGGDGSRALWGGRGYVQPVFPVKAVDTTGAGDTFTGYFLASLSSGASAADSLALAAKAAAISVSLPGAAGSIPTLAQVRAYAPSVSTEYGQ